ncbi:MAG TPA: hypothetical protein VFH83_13945 [Spirochaetia bacterium]|nr:hypothetical protein [Spirochaetia bacterium]
MRKAVCLLLLVACPFLAAAQDETRAGPAYTVQSPGKYLHFLAGMSLGMLGAGLAEYALQPTYPSQYPLVLPSVAISVALPAGIAKELLDATGFGDARLTDVLITTAGGLLASMMVGYAEALYPANSRGKSNSVALLLSTSALLAVPVAIGFAREVRNNLEKRR